MREEHEYANPEQEDRQQESEDRQPLRRRRTALKAEGHAHTLRVLRRERDGAERERNAQREPHDRHSATEENAPDDRADDAANKQVRCEEQLARREALRPAPVNLTAKGESGDNEAYGRRDPPPEGDTGQYDQGCEGEIPECQRYERE